MHVSDFEADRSRSLSVVCGEIAEVIGQSHARIRMNEIQINLPGYQVNRPLAITKLSLERELWDDLFG
jgi:hypothetical protein